jgi:hypothetical protein
MSDRAGMTFNPEKKLFQECEFVLIIRYVMLMLTLYDYTLSIL